MKVQKCILFLLLIGWPQISENLILAQSQGFNFQAVAKDQNGTLPTNTSINVRFSVREGANSGFTFFQELHPGVVTGNGSLFSLVIGGGTLSQVVLVPLNGLRPTNI